MISTSPKEADWDVSDSQAERLLEKANYSKDSGLGYTHCDVGACLNVTADHLGVGAIETLEDLAEVKRIVGEVPRIICSELEREGIAAAKITQVNNAMTGVRAALDWAEPGDFLFLQVLSERDEVTDYLLSLSEQERR
ncbi:MAG: hypothetical protein QGD92_00750 [Gammaproteobacteria bacterium]|nr:hypothetical protein [Gammaproteobacteria bacterium]